MTGLLSAALEYTAQGIAIMPCAPGGKKPALPTTGKEHSVASSEADQIRQWWATYPNANIGIACTPNRIAVIDIDGEAGAKWITDNHLPMPATWTVTTGRGYHYYYRWPAGMEIRTCQIAPKLEIRAAGAYVIAPPSIHPDGDTYQCAPRPCEWEELPVLPVEWVSLQPQPQAQPETVDNVTYLQAPPSSTTIPLDNIVALKRLAGLAEHLANTPSGNRHSALYTISRTLGQLVASRHLTEYLIHNALFDATATNGLLAEDGDHNVTQTITNGIAKGIDDGPDPGHHEPAQHNAYTLTPPGAGISATEPDDGIHEVNMTTIITAEFDDAQWLIEPIIPAHRAVALYAAGKTGKSLLVLDFVAAAASGRPILGDAPIEPIHILYVDQEMTQPDLQERLHDLGYTQPDPTLTEHLHYYQLAPWPPFDTAAGGQRLLQEALKTKAQLVVIDTLIRTLEGDENSADTIKDFTRYTGTPLKANDIALLRIDHAGKDPTRGQRGTSAKRDDVDVVWLLQLASGSLPGKTMLTLKREAARIDWIQQDVSIVRNEGPPLNHIIPTVNLTSGDIEIMHYLEGQGLWRHNITVRDARDALNDSIHTAKQVRLAHIVRWVKRYGNDPPEKEGNAEGNAKTQKEGNAEGNVRREKVTPRSEEGNVRVTPSEPVNQGKGNIPPLFKGGDVPTPNLTPPPTRSKRRRRRTAQSHGKPFSKQATYISTPPQAKEKHGKVHPEVARDPLPQSGDTLVRITDCGSLLTVGSKITTEYGAAILNRCGVPQDVFRNT